MVTWDNWLKLLTKYLVLDKCSKSLLVFFCYLTNYHKFSRSQPFFFFLNFTSFLWQKSGYSWARLLFSVSKRCNQCISQAALLPRVLIWAHLVVGRIQFLAVVRLTSALSSCLSVGGAPLLLVTNCSSFPCGPLTDPFTSWLISSRPERESLCLVP